MSHNSDIKRYAKILEEIKHTSKAFFFFYIKNLFFIIHFILFHYSLNFNECVLNHL